MRKTEYYHFSINLLYKEKYNCFLNLLTKTWKFPD